MNCFSSGLLARSRRLLFDCLFGKIMELDYYFREKTGMYTNWAKFIIHYCRSLCDRQLMLSTYPSPIRIHNSNSNQNSHPYAIWTASDFILFKIQFDCFKTMSFTLSLSFSCSKGFLFGVNVFSNNVFGTAPYIFNLYRQYYNKKIYYPGAWIDRLTFSFSTFPPIELMGLNEKSVRLVTCICFCFLFCSGDVQAHLWTFCIWFNSSPSYHPHTLHTKCTH